MQEKCPICKNNIKTNDIVCSVCGFSELHKEFITEEDGALWVENIVKPYRKQYIESKKLVLEDEFRSIASGADGFDKSAFDMSIPNEDIIEEVDRLKASVKSRNRFIIFLLLLAGIIFAFIWKDGMLKDYIVKYFLFISPYGREMATVDKFRFSLNVSTVCTGIAFLINFITFMADIKEEKKRYLSRWLALITSTFGIWYCGYFACFLVAKISVWYYFLASLSVVGVSAIAWFIVTLTVESLFDIGYSAKSTTSKNE